LTRLNDSMLTSALFDKALNQCYKVGMRQMF